jgi:hypothetical protein
MENTVQRVLIHGSAWKRIVILGTALLIAGCARKEEQAAQPVIAAAKPEAAPEHDASPKGSYDETLKREQVETYTKLVGRYEKVTNQEEFKREMAAIDALEGKLQRLKRQVAELPPERRQVGRDFATEEIRQIAVRYHIAKKNALSYK